MSETILALAKRFESYRESVISTVIDEHDGMYERGVPGALEEYLAVGRSAIEVIAQAMVATDKTAFGSVLDLPCGGGRVARQLVAFFPDAQFFVGDLDKGLEAFTAETFGAERVEVASDFSNPPGRQFDLIFVGSLLPHLDAELFERALRWFIGALAPGGLLVTTTSGRRHDFLHRTVLRYIPTEQWEAVAEARAETGFGFVETETKAGRSYGLSLCTPSWLMSLVENDPAVRIVGFKEAAWGDHQDALFLERRGLFDRYRLQSELGA